MSDKVIIYSREDGGVSVIHPADATLSMEKIAEISVPSGTSYKIVNASSIPSDRIFRNAWKEGSTKVSVDIPKAKELTHEARRFARDGEMAPFDLKVTIPDESAAAEAERVKLRKKYADLQTEIDASSTETALKSVMKKLP